MDHPAAPVERPEAPWSTGQAGDAALDGAQATSPGGLRHHRPPVPELAVVESDPVRFEVRTPWHVFTGDLGKGLVLQALRDGPAAGPTICHSGNILEFRHEGRAASLDVETHIVGCGLDRAPGRLVLWHESRFPLPDGGRGWRLFRRRAAAAAALLLRYDYAILADSPVLHLTVTLRTDPPGMALERPRLTTALDDLSAAPLAARRVLAWPAGSGADAEPRPWPAPGGTGTTEILLHAGATRHLAFAREGVGDGGATPQTCHLRLVDSGRLASLRGAAHPDGRLHWAVLRYAGAALGPGEPMILREERLLVPGGFPLGPPDAAGLALIPAPEAPPPPPRPPAVFLGDRLLAWTEGRRRILLMPDDIDLTPSILESGTWEAHVAATLRRLLAPGMRAADVGANIGFHTLVMADAVGPAGRVHAFEAHPALAGLLRDSVTMNGLEGAVSVHGGTAVLDREGGEVVLAAADRRRGSGHVVPPQAPASPEHDAAYPHRLIVPATTLDAALAGGGALDLLRMDVEGSEPLVLRGAAALMARSPELRILMEWSVPMMAGRADVGGMVEQLAAQGFRAWRIEEDARLSPVSATALIALPHSDVLFARRDPA